MRTILIDDHPLFRQGLAGWLRKDPEIEIVGDAGTARDAIELARATSPDVAILDVLMRGASGITITHELLEVRRDCRVLALSAIEEPGLIADMLRAGAAGYVLKSDPVDTILDAIRHVASGAVYLSPSVPRAAVEAELANGMPAPLAKLTKREREIFELLIRGYTNAEIAAKLFIALRTVETHRQRITRKLSARSVFELQRIAARYAVALG